MELDFTVFEQDISRMKVLELADWLVSCRNQVKRENFDTDSEYYDYFSSMYGDYYSYDNDSDYYSDYYYGDDGYYFSIKKEDGKTAVMAYLI